MSQDLTAAPPQALITGSSGLVGRALQPALAAEGYRLVLLGRRPGATPGQAGSVAHRRWDPANGHLEAEDVEGMDIVIHLAGENVAAGRWTAYRRQAIRQSRVEGTSLLCRRLAACRRKPRLVICASAVGYYGDTGESWVDEDSPPGDGFLADVGLAWERAADPARAAGMRVVHLRFGIILSRQGGALQRMLPVFRLGLGGRLGSGRQYMSWLTLTEAISIIRFAISQDHLHGAINAVTPEPVTNATFTAALARTLRRPAFCAVPAWGARALLGEMAQALLLTGQRVQPRRLQESGYTFLHPGLETALQELMGNTR